MRSRSKRKRPCVQSLLLTVAAMLCCVAQNAAADDTDIGRKGFSEGLAMVEGWWGNGYGYIDRTGEWVVQPKLGLVGRFRGGVAKAIEYKGDDEWASWYIDRTGERVPDKFGSSFETLKAFTKDGKHGYLDTTSGEVVIEPQYDYAHSFRDGLARVSKRINGEYCEGFIDITGRAVVPLSGFHAQDFHEGLAAMQGKVTAPASDAGKTKWGFIDRTGKFAIPPQYDRAYGFSEGLGVVISNGKYGFVDRAGKFVIPAKFRKATAFSEGLAAVKPSDEEAESTGLVRDPRFGYGWGYIDRTGQYVIPPQFKQAEKYSEGLAYVWLEQFADGYIDRAGKLVIDLPKVRERIRDNKRIDTPEIVRILEEESITRISTSHSQTIYITLADGRRHGGIYEHEKAGKYSKDRKMWDILNLAKHILDNRPKEEMKDLKSFIME